MAKNDKEYEALAAQIGDLGGEPMVEENNEPKSLGRVRPEAYGGKRELTAEEKKQVEDFDKRVNQIRESQEEGYHSSDHMDLDTPIADGWIPLDRRTFGIRSKFYPSDWEFYIRPATVQAIKNWISIDESNALQMNHTFDEIIKLCVKIKSSVGTIPWSRINTWDRFWIILKVREASFASNKKTITFEDNCAECDNEITFELTPDALHYEFPDDDLVEKYWNAEDMTWEIDPAEYGLDDEEVIVLHTPTLAVQQAIIDWAQRQYNRKKQPDEVFTTNFLPWMIDKVVKDENVMDKKIQKIEKAYKNWSVDLHSFMTNVVRNITINPQETLKQRCPHCGEEVVSNVQFPGGVKVLFETESRVQKFGSR